MKDYEECWRKLRDYLERQRDLTQIGERETETSCPDIYRTYVKLDNAIQQIMRAMEEIEWKEPLLKPEVNKYARRWHTLMRRIEEQEAVYRRRSDETICYSIGQFNYGMACGYYGILKEMEQMMLDEEEAGDE